MAIGHHTAEWHTRVFTLKVQSGREKNEGLRLDSTH